VPEVVDATPADHGGIVALTTAAFGASEEAVVRAWLDGPGAGGTQWTVVRHEGRVVSCSVSVPLDLRLDGHPLPALQIEFVATHPDHRGRGLVRAQLARHHERARRDGLLVQIVLGIPYFYRRFGYGYGLDYPVLWCPRREALRPDPSVTVRSAHAGDLPALAALERRRPADGLRADRTWPLARQLAASAAGHPPGSGADRLLVAERSGVAVGWAALLVRPTDGRLWVLPALTADDGATDALLAHALAVADAEAEAQPLPVYAHDSPGTPWSARLAAVGTPWARELGIYVRMEDPVAVLRHLRPVLSARLAASPWGGGRGEVTISRYVDAVRLHWDGGEVTAVEPAPAEPDPAEVGACGVAPDWFPALVLGRWGAADLAHRMDDVMLGPQAGVLDALFPRGAADIVADF
jgi:predicted N-acetyltransferase YhbS